MEHLAPSIVSICRCGEALFFPNSQCLSCGAAVGFLLSADRVVSLLQTDDLSVWLLPDQTRRVRTCLHRTGPVGCNWLVEDEAPSGLCDSCRLTRTTPDRSQPDAEKKWTQAEAAKRRVLAGLHRLGLRLRPLTEVPTGAAFDLLTPQPGAPPIMTGHENGVITLNLDEADPSMREAVREQMGERYRTLEGHFRHELAHYLWERLAADPMWRGDFDACFGNADADYAAALQRHHSEGAPPDWPSTFISAYASSHPWEDWAETTAHYLHGVDGVDTARAMGLDVRRLHLFVERFDPAVLGECTATPEAASFLSTVDQWVRVSLLGNELNRALGHADAYPFVLSAPVVRKLWFIHRSLRLLASRL